MARNEIEGRASTFEVGLGLTRFDGHVGRRCQYVPHTGTSGDAVNPGTC
jgi:hypothetical protein